LQLIKIIQINTNTMPTFEQIEIAMLDIDGGTMPPASQLNGTVLNPFQIGIYLIRIAEWEVVRKWAVQNGFDLRVGRAGGHAPLPWDVSPSPWTAPSPNHPVTEISWYDALKWCNAKSLIDGLDPVYTLKGRSEHYRSEEFGSEVAFDWIEGCSKANGYRLPTDAEWEWAARGGCRSRGFIYSGSNDLNQVGWYEGNSCGQVHPVEKKAPNEIGLYDMSGNVNEWIWGLGSDVSDRCPTHRGGSWNCYQAECAVSERYFGNRNYFATTVGLRLARYI